MGVKEDLIVALREVVEANDAYHNTLAGSPSDPEDHAAFVAAQRRETAAIEAARELLQFLDVPVRATP